MGPLVNKIACLGALLLVWVPLSECRAHCLWNRFYLERLNRKIQGQVVDHTDNHGSDRRIWSSALNEKRSLYVYLPPNYDPRQRYPLMLWLHGFAQDEKSFLQQVVEDLDSAMAGGRLPPMIVVAPDGSLTRNPFSITAGSFFLNSRAGAFEDFVMTDVWNFMLQQYPIRPEQGAGANLRRVVPLAHRKLEVYQMASV